MTDYIPLRPDPRISTSPPAWLPGGGWQDTLCAMTDDDLDWIADQWHLADGPAVDTSWIQTTTIGGPDRFWIVPLMLLVFAVLGLVFSAWEMQR